MKKKMAFGFSVLVIAIAFLFSACGNNNDSNTSGPAPAKYSTPDDAAASASAAGSAMSTISDLAASLDVMSQIKLPASLAAKRSAKAGLTTSGKTDPQVKALLDKAAGIAKTAMMQKVFQKTNSFKTSRSVSINATYDAGDGVCTSGGSMTIVGSNNSDDLSRTYGSVTYTITFNNCDDGTTVANGSFTVHAKSYYDYSSMSYSESMTNLTFVDGSGNTVTLNASYGLNLSEPDADHFTETVTANGYFADRDQYGAEARFTFSSVSEKFTYANDTATGHETSKATINGGMRFALKDNVGTLVLALSISATNFGQEVLYYNDLAGTEEDRINGTVALSWTPVIGGCSPGSVTFKTVEPMTYTTAGGSEPVSGLVKVNGATVEFATPSGTQITVTLANGDSMVYADMAELDAAASSCTSTPSTPPPAAPTAS
jgi:hypothetical protein